MFRSLRVSASAELGAGGEAALEQAVIEPLVWPLELIVVDELVEDSPELPVAQRNDLR